MPVCEYAGGSGSATGKAAARVTAGFGTSLISLITMKITHQTGVLYCKDACVFNTLDYCIGGMHLTIH